ncbi:MAG: bifunctional UDP-N-acetylglucosamine diphosphorylase/glucosamine-1-phosphate N-acetyltransferase GlmU [Pseudazoarcus pumilus]|nr:bifunctional UDP-N-acetylglucosamine diphosphorylase/glucosamine-1-phosphate N-acetyltransferase GlmU [Pseudazoarcus pumilus]
MDVVILAAGKGTRMRSSQPKVLQPLAGRPLLAHVLETARALDAARICVVVGHGADAVRGALDAPGLRWVLQSPQLGTGHAVQQALPEMSSDGVALVLYGDVPMIRRDTLARLVAAADGKRLALLTQSLPDPVGYGRIVRDALGKVQRIVEHKDATELERKIREVNTGILVAPVVFLRDWLARIGNDNAQGEYYLTDIVGLAVADGIEVVSASPTAEWETLGVNDRRQLAALERTLQANVADALLDAGVTLIDPARIDVRGHLSCGMDVEIDVNCVFEGRVVLGDGVKVGANCVLRDVVIGAGTRIAPFSHLDSTTTGAGCIIGPYARTRPGTVLADEVHLGNFVEVKNSNIGTGSKANHLAYVGDADVGAGVNIGAGVITCNYDGANKHRTIIEDEAFVGSDVQLVAPVRVGRGATVGAGTTLTRDAPEEQLTVSRVKQTSLRWKRPVKKST